MDFSGSTDDILERIVLDDKINSEQKVVLIRVVTYIERENRLKQHIRKIYFFLTGIVTLAIIATLIIGDVSIASSTIVAVGAASITTVLISPGVVNWILDQAAAIGSIREKIVGNIRS